MYYKIRHLTRFRYTAPVYESVTEVRMHPRGDDDQRLLSFSLSVHPRARVMPHTDHVGNIFHSFTIPGHHTQMTITAEAAVSAEPGPVMPEALDPGAWDELDQLVAQEDYWEMLLSSPFTEPTDLLTDLGTELKVKRRDDPMTVLRDLTTAIYERFEYKQLVTEVHSPIDDALQKRAGVCQDFAHIMIALVRPLGIPCRYISGYLAPQSQLQRAESIGATHAWIEALLPKLGWVGFDPTNNTVAANGHIRVAIGRDYADVPPTRGVYKGEAGSELSVAVQVTPHEEIKVAPEVSSSPRWILANGTTVISEQEEQEQQQQ